ncbi:hypothetical protein LguiB_000951 [Lonicera macranthoides]
MFSLFFSLFIFLLLWIQIYELWQLIKMKQITYFQLIDFSEELNEKLYCKIIVL